MNRFERENKELCDILQKKYPNDVIWVYNDPITFAQRWKKKKGAL